MIKMYILHILLMLRRDNPDLFAFGTYTPVPAQGEKKNHVIAFVREYQGTIILPQPYKVYLCR